LEKILMAYAIQDDIMGLPAIASTNTVQGAPIGMIAHAVDPVLGGGEFVYLPGVTGTSAGTLVQYDQQNRVTSLAQTNNSGAPLVVAMSTNLAGQWGWYQMTGNALVNKDNTVLAAGGPVGVGTVPGTVGAPAAGRQISGAKAQLAAAGGATSAQILLNRPNVQTQIV
jgi:hypothetical protein